jgi:PleD family two-component response regulator
MTTPNKISLLIVDDETCNIEIIASIFGNDYEVLFATDGKKALEIALSEKPDLILLDIMMPETDGFQVCRQLRNMPDTEHIPIIFITALDDVNAEVHGLSIGAIDFITKPFNPAITKMRVKKQIEQIRHLNF